MSETLLLCIAAILFVATHLGLSSTPLRGVLVGMLGDNGFLGVYSLISIAVIVWLAVLYAGMPHADFLWNPSLVTSALARCLMALSVLLLVLGLGVRNPTAMRMESALGEQATGILRITRHPVQWGFLVWAVSHMIANGDVASLLFFGSFAVVAGCGTVLLDRKLSRRAGENWAEFAAQTSNVPFLAIVQGRNRMLVGEIGWVRPLVALVLFVALYLFHAMFTGVALLAL